MLTFSRLPAREKPGPVAKMATMQRGLPGSFLGMVLAMTVFAAKIIMTTGAQLSCPGCNLCAFQTIAEVSNTRI